MDLDSVSSEDHSHLGELYLDGHSGTGLRKERERSQPTLFDRSSRASDPNDVHNMDDEREVYVICLLQL